MALHSVRNLRRGLAVLALALPGLYAVSAGVAIVQDYRSTIGQAKSDMRNIAATLHEHAMRTFGEADTRLRVAITEIERRGLAPAARHERELHDILVAATVDSPLAGSAGVMSPDGFIRASAYSYPMMPVDGRDRDYYRWLSSHSGHGMYISRSVQSRLSGRWVIPVARRVDNPDGTLRMIANFGTYMSYFDQFYRSLKLGDSSRLVLLRRDGWAIMETPLTTGVLDQDLSRIQPFRMLDKEPVGSYETDRSVVDGTARVAGYASLPGSPVVAVASIGRAEVLQPWVTRSWQFAGLGALSMVLLLALLRFLWLKLAELEATQESLFEAIHVDPLTRLPSRRALMEHIEHALVLAQHNRSVTAVVLVDVDNFSTLNDSLGHEHGDHVLMQIAERLQDCLEPTDMLARMGGDEFAIVMEDVDRLALNVKGLAERIRAALERAVPVDGRKLYLTASMGIALSPQDGQDFQTLVRNADTALYRVKAAGRNGWQFFDSSMARQVEHRLDMETALRHAIDHEEFRLEYQPQRSLGDGSIVGAEALVRWNRPGVGAVQPQEFIRMAEESGFIVLLGNWVLTAACCQAARWRAAGLNLRIAVNVSVVQLRHAQFVEQVRRALEESGLPPQCLELEITEGAFVSDILDALDKLHRIKAMGVELAVDDFGTGYSSLSYLKQMPVDRLKIDQSFVRDIPDDADDCAIVRAILAMAANLKLEVIAEGVESERQLEFLRAEGCQEIQGYFVSRPVSADSFAAHFSAGALAT
jgi:diguanylate cyclase (GGDEF)-like protein